jgi:hypothetical protein
MSRHQTYYHSTVHQPIVKPGCHLNSENMQSRSPKAAGLPPPKIHLFESILDVITAPQTNPLEVQDIPPLVNSGSDPVIKVQSGVPNPDLTEAQCGYALKLKAQHIGIREPAAAEMRASPTRSVNVKLNIRKSERFDVPSTAKSSTQNLRATVLQPPSHSLGPKNLDLSNAVGERLCKLVAPDLRPYINLPKTRRGFKSNTFLILKVRRDTVPRPTPFNLSWLSKMYGAHVHLSNKVATMPLKYLYITNCDVIFDNYLESGSLAVYLNPVPDRLVYMYSQVPNTAYVVQEDVSVICPEVTLVPHNPTPYNRGHRLQIVAERITDEHPYGLPLGLRVVIFAGPRSGVDTNIQVHNPWLEAAVVDAQEVLDEKDDIVEPTDPAFELTEERLQQHDTIENVHCKSSSHASSVSSSGSILKPDIIDKVERWKKEYTITGGSDSKEATRSSVLFESYAAFCGGVNKCGVKRSNDFGKYIRALWPEDERYWPKKDGKYYRGIILKK